MLPPGSNFRPTHAGVAAWGGSMGLQHIRGGSMGGRGGAAWGGSMGGQQEAGGGRGINYPLLTTSGAGSLMFASDLPQKIPLSSFRARALNRARAEPRRGGRPG